MSKGVILGISILVFSMGLGASCAYGHTSGGGGYGMMGSGMMGMMRGGMMGMMPGGMMGMGMPGGMMRPGMMGPAMMGYGMLGGSPVDSYLYYRDELNLSDAQVKQLKSLRSEYRQETSKLNTKSFDLQSEISDLYDEGASYGAIRKKQKEINKLAEEQSDVYYGILEKAEKVLTPDQLKKIRSGRLYMYRLREGEGREMEDMMKRMGR